jgi:hypothetical protein
VYRDQRADPGFDYGLVIADLAKALEVTVNAVLRRAATKIARDPPAGQARGRGLPGDIHRPCQGARQVMSR